MKIEDFDYHLPEELIAQKPAEKRDASRLLVVHRDTGKTAHRHFYDIETFNVNADYAAGAVSGALEAEKLILLSDIKGLYRDINDEDSFIPEINCDKVKEYIEDGTIAGGMIPKMQCCVDAIQKGAREVVIIDGRVEHSLLIEIFTHSGSGTMVTK